MANIKESAVWEDGIYQLEITDPVQGGEDGIDNKQARQLANRTLYLKQQQEKSASGLGAINAQSVDGLGRNILTLLGVTTIAEAMAEIRRRCNNNGEIDSTGIPHFGDLMVGDYIDELDLSGIAAPASGDAPQAWNDQYKNNRIIIAGFNTYKNSGDTENTKNHILFRFRNCCFRSRMNSTNTNTNGYRASELRTYLEGTNGDGSGVFSSGLKVALGGDYLYTIRKAHSQKGSSGWFNFTVFLPTEIEIFGFQTYGDELEYWNTNVQFPLFQNSYVYRMPRWNGARHWNWTQTPSAGSSSSFVRVDSSGSVNGGTASTVGGCAPAFCVA